VPNAFHLEDITYVAELNFVIRKNIFLVVFCIFAFSAGFNMGINKIVIFYYIMRKNASYKS
jgi:hypothetical protein